MKERKFTHVSGFWDDTKYVVVREDGTSYLINDLDEIRESGCFKRGFFTLEECLERVARGIWKEIV